MTAARSLSAEIRGAQTKTHKNISARAVMAKKKRFPAKPRQFHLYQTAFRRIPLRSGRVLIMFYGCDPHVYNVRVWAEKSAVCLTV